MEKDTTSGHGEAELETARSSCIKVRLFAFFEGKMNRLERFVDYQRVWILLDTKHVETMGIRKPLKHTLNIQRFPLQIPSTRTSHDSILSLRATRTRGPHHESRLFVVIVHREPSQN